MVSNEGKEILRGIGLLAEHIICMADSYGEVADKRKVVIDISETAARAKKEVKHISIKDLKMLNDKYGIAIFEYVDMLDAAARKEPYNNNEVRFKADAKEVFYSIQHLLYVWICHLNHIIKVENFLLIFPHLRKTKKFTNIFIVQNVEFAEIT